MFFDHVVYEDVLLTISTAAELAILYLVFMEGRKVVANVNEIRDATTGTVYGYTDDLPVGSRVFVLEPQPGVPRAHIIQKALDLFRKTQPQNTDPLPTYGLIEMEQGQIIYRFEFYERVVVMAWTRFTTFAPLATIWAPNRY